MVGLLVGLLIVPGQPAHAQWAVYDAAVHSQQVKDSIARAKEWIERVKQYQAMYDKAVQQWTTMRGILRTADETLAKHKDLALLTMDIGDIIRGSFRLKRELEAMVKYRIKALKSIDDRLSNGIFDPDADLRDFEEYLQYSIGRSSRQTVAQMVRTANKDQQLATWMDEKAKLERGIAEANKTLKEYKKLLEAELVKAVPDQRNIQNLNDAINRETQLIEDLKRQHSEVTEKINQRVVQYGVRIEDMENFGYQVQSVNEAWAGLNKTKDNIYSLFDGLITSVSR
jgi:chromosome segregation ATPase